jgi:hypothetical protein
MNNVVCGESTGLSVFALGLAPSARFSDVPAHGLGEHGTDPHWAFEEIEACAGADIVQGYPDGTYHPEWPITRDQMAVYTSRGLAGGDANLPHPTEDPGFTDVTPEHWAYRHIAYAAGQDIVEGYPEGDYRPEQIVTRDQMAVYIARSLCDPTGDEGLVGYIPPDPRNFPDVAAEHWAYSYVEYCVDNDIVGGYNPTTYAPAVTVTRDQMAVYICRGFELPI